MGKPLLKLKPHFRQFGIQGKGYGFSLVELMVVITVAVVVLGVGVPSFYSLLQNQRMVTTTNDFFAAINLTRSEAIQRGRRVDLVPADGQSWASGWRVFVDENNNYRPDSGEIIFEHDAIPVGMTIVASMTDSSVQYLSYNGTGRTQTYASSFAPQSGTWSFFQDGKAKRRIKIGFLGRPRVCTPGEDSTCTGADDPG